MFISLVREHKWPPSVLDGLFFDREDHHGLMFWYDDLKEVSENMKNKSKK